MYVFKPNVFAEHSSNSITKPCRRMISKIRCDGKNVYIYHGIDPTPEARKCVFRELWVYNLARKQWRLMRKKILAFDLEKCRWKIINTDGDENHIPQYPAEREDFGMTSYIDPDSSEINVILSGGKVNYKEPVNDVWKLNLTSLKWTCLERFGTVLPCYVSNHSMTVSPAGKLFTFGGYIYNHMNRAICISTLHSTWLRIPKLTDICWEAVFHYYPNLKSMTDDEIISLGIPLQSFKSRII